jgi:leucyl aminopeptidase
MNIQTRSQMALDVKADVLAIGVFSTASKSSAKKTKNTTSKASEAKLPAWAAPLDKKLAGFIKKEMAALGFKGNTGQTLQLHGNGKTKAQRIILVGLGASKDASSDAYRLGAAQALKSANKLKAANVAIYLPEDKGVSPESQIKAMAEGSELSSYQFTKYLSSPKGLMKVKTAQFIHNDITAAKAKNAVSQGKSIAAGVALARDLVNETPEGLSPIEFAKRARTVGRECGLTVTVMDEKKLAAERMNMLLAVGRAASPYTPSRVVQLKYRPKGKAKKHIALVGKGLVFDSGGLDLKPAAGMLNMKLDMGGAGCVLGAMAAIGKLKPNVAVTAYLGCVENGIGGNAYHPGDVLRSRKGITVEINNTDAEGRLVLADCIDYALTKDKPDVLIDVATLTGAAMVALGDTTAALYSRQDGLAEGLLEAGKAAGEDFWRMPLNDRLFAQLRSDIADMKNTGERFGGSITAALFLEKFVAGRADWAHLDIAGPAMTSKGNAFTPKGGVGFGAATLARYVADHQ